MLTTLAGALDLEPVQGLLNAEGTEKTAELTEAPEVIVEMTALEEVDALLDEAPLPIKPPPPKGPVFVASAGGVGAGTVELSSSMKCGASSPTAAAVLNLTQDHLDWHGDMAAYGRAKARIFGEDAVMVINRDDPRVEAMVPAPVLVKQGPRQGGQGERPQGRPLRSRCAGSSG